MSFWDYIVWPFARLMEFLYNWTQNYGIALILFALVVNVILLPFMAKSKKSMMRTSLFQPYLKELERKYKGNQQKYQQEVTRFYKEEGIKPMSGCLWSLIPFPILIALYSVIRQPIAKMMGISSDGVATITEWATKFAGYTAQGRDTYAEIGVADAIHNNWDAAMSALSDFADKLINIDYSFLGINLGKVPDFKIWEVAGDGWSSIGLFLVPFIAALLSWLSMTISQKTNPSTNDQAAAQMKTMNLMMPLVSLWMCFIMPAALGIYWIANSVFGIARDVTLTSIFKKGLEAEDAERRERLKKREAELERRREETARLRAEGATVRNDYTSKKKLQAQQKQQNAERRAAADRAEREARRERLGIDLEENPSQVGNRRYARGRAYDPNRYANVQTEETAPEVEAEQAEDMPE